MSRETASEEMGKGIMKKMKTKNRNLHPILNHAMTVGFVSQANPDLTDFKGVGLSWSLETSEL